MLNGVSLGRVLFIFEYIKVSSSFSLYKSSIILITPSYNRGIWFAPIILSLVYFSMLNLKMRSSVISPNSGTYLFRKSLSSLKWSFLSLSEELMNILSFPNISLLFIENLISSPKSSWLGKSSLSSVSVSHPGSLIFGFLALSVPSEPSSPLVESVCKF